jgi:hemerythrin-like metal-binding protein
MKSKNDSGMVKWDDGFSIGISAIDGQHKTLLQMSNDLIINALHRDKSQGSYLQSMIKKLIVYVRHHLFSEELLMETVGYSSLSKHREKHEEFLDKIMNLGKIETGEYNEPHKLASLLHDWTLSHIAVMDNQFGQFFFLFKITG